MLLVIFYVWAGVSAAGLLMLAWALVTAPEAYEDQQGFHLEAHPVKRLAEENWESSVEAKAVVC